jgi:hypothetical protein
MQDTPENRGEKLPPEKSTFGDTTEDVLDSQERKMSGNRVIRSLDKDQIPIRIQFEPSIDRYLETLLTGGFGVKDGLTNLDSLNHDKLALSLMLSYFFLISGRSAEVQELESEFVNRIRGSALDSSSGSLFFGITFFEMINRANRAYKNEKSLDRIYRKAGTSRNVASPLAEFSDDEIAELIFVTYLGDLPMHYFKNLVSEYENRKSSQARY